MAYGKFSEISRSRVFEETAGSIVFTPYASKIVDKIRRSLLQGRNDVTIEVEMYKLNVYGEYCL
jgi:hypothetical protein